MANDKDFKVKNGVQPTRYVEGLGTVVAGTEGPSGLFSTTLYSGNGGTQSINTGIDLAGDGGLVWTKCRNNTHDHHLFDTERGVLKRLRTNSEAAEHSEANSLTAFNSNGHTLGSEYAHNGSTQNFVSWTWKKQSNFFDIVTYAGNGSARSIAHNLGSVPGMIIIKGYDRSDGWAVYHRGANGGTDPEDYVTFLSGSNAQSNSASHFNDTAPTSTHFTVGTESMVNSSSNNYVAYLFAHNSTSINCGTYTGNGSSTGPVVTTGFQPQWLMFKCTSNADDWVIVDTQRGISATGNDTFLKPNTSGADYGFLDAISVTSTGFNVTGTDNVVNGNGRTYIYMAIAAVIDTDTLDLSTGSVFNYSPTASKTLKLSNPASSGTNSGATLLYNSTDLAGVADKFSTTLYTGNAGTQTITNGLNLAGEGGLVWIKKRNATADHYLADTERGATKFLVSNETDIEDTNTSTLTSFNNGGFTIGDNSRVNSYTLTDSFVSWSFLQASNFFDVVKYTGNSTNRTIAHNLGEVPGMIIVKNTSTAGYSWQVYHRSLANTERIELDGTGAKTTGATTYWNSTTATSSVFSIGTHDQVNKTGSTFVAYVFGHNNSKVKCGSYTGNGQSTGVAQNLGFRPQFMLFKNTSASSGWSLADSVRGEDQLIEGNATGAESTADIVDFTDTGFTPKSNFSNTNTNGHTFIYMAIASEQAASTTYDSSIKWSGGEAPTSPAIGETDVITLDTTDGGTTYRAAHAIDGAK